MIKKDKPPRRGARSVKNILNDKGVGREGFIMDTTERRRIEETLRDSEEKFRDLVEDINDVIYTIDKEGRYTYVSAAVQSIFGYSPEEFMQRQVGELVHPDDRPLLIEGFHNVLAGIQKPNEYRIFNKAGEIRWIRSSSKPIIVNGVLTGIKGIATDITKQKLAQEALRRSEETHRALVEGLPDIIMRFDHDGRHLFVSENVHELAGIPAATLIGKTNRELGFPESLCTFMEESIRKVFKSGLPLETEFTFEGPHKTIVFNWRLIPELDEQWQVRTVLSICRDITEQKRITQALNLSEEKFRKAFNTSPDAVNFNRLEDGMYSSINPGFTRILGYTEEDVIGKTSLELNIWNNVEDRERLVTGLQKDGSVSNLEAAFRTRNGDIRHGLMSASIVELNGVPYILNITRDITERKRAEVNLRESEEKHRRLFETMAQGVVYHAADGSIISANPAAERILGLSLDQMLGKTSMDPRWKMISEDGSDVAGTEHPATIAMRTGHAVGPVIRGVFHPAKNDYVWLSITAIPLFQPEETTPFQVYATFEDITDRKQAQETLRKKDILLANLASQVPGMLFQFKRGPDGTYCVPYSSNGIKDIFGCSPEEVHDHFEPIFRAIFPEDREKVSQSIDASWQTLSPWICEYRVQVPGQPLKWILGTSTPEKLADGSILWSGYDLDITESKQAEEELVSSNAKLNALWTIASLVDADTKTIADHILASITRMSASRYGFYGFISEDESVMTIHAWSADAMAACGMADKPQHFPISDAGMWGEAIRRRKPFILNDCIAPHPAKKGLPEGHVALTNLMVVPHFFQGRMTAVAAVANSAGDYGPDDVKQLTAFLDSAQLIVEHRRSEEEKEKLQTQLTQAQKMESIGRLAGGVAHDFNNMLGVILGNTELAMDHSQPATPLYAELLEIRKAAERSADLTRQLLAFARQQTVTPRVLDLNQTMANSLKMLQRLIGEDIELSWLPGSGIWQVMVDPSQMDQILANLCVNARDAIGETGIISIETGNASFDEAYCESYAGYVQGDFVLLSVSDNGHGMNRETMDRMFEPFFTTKELGKGTGLGLSTVYGIVKQNNGFINVYSEPGQGTTFKIYLPRHVGKSQQLQENHPAEPAAGGRETILLTEDEPPMLRMIRVMLERQGYNVLTASTPGEAIRLARENMGEIHLLITDVIMPEMNGRDLTKNILTLFPNIKRLFMSGYTADVIAHRGMLDAGTNFIQKPFSKADLSAKVREVLDSE